MSPVGSCRLFRLEPSGAALFGLRAVLYRPVPPSSAWFVCKIVYTKASKPRAPIDSAPDMAAGRGGDPSHPTGLKKRRPP
jgi:hypothetical protein